MVLAAIRVPLGTHPTYLGEHYAALSRAPFSPDPANPVGYRILTPLVSHLAGLRGSGIIVTNMILATILLALVFGLRDRGVPAGRALHGASILALSMVTLTTIRYGGYCDALTFLLVFLAWRARSRPPVASLMILLALLNHESVLFLLPWFGFVLASQAGSGPRPKLAACGWLLASVGAFAVIRELMARHTPGVAFSGGYYLRPLLHDPLRWFQMSAPHRGLGVFAAFNLYWLLPILGIADQLRRREFTAALTTFLPFPCALVQLLVAYDVTRLLALSFMGVLLSAEHLLRTDAFQARRWMLWLSVANFFVPQVNVAMGNVDPMR